MGGENSLHAAFAVGLHDITHHNGHGICVSNPETSLAFDSLLEVNLKESALGECWLELPRRRTESLLQATHFAGGEIMLKALWKL